MDNRLDAAWHHYENSGDLVHGADHIRSVLSYSKQIASKYPNIDLSNLEQAAILHDIGHSVNEDRFVGGHVGEGLRIYQQYAKSVPERNLEAIHDAIETHHGNVLPRTQIGRIVRDADRLANTSATALANRAYEYRLAKGMSRDAAAKSAYHYLRHSKLNRLDARTESAFSTPEGKDLYRANIEDFRHRTGSYAQYASLLNNNRGETDKVNTNYKSTSEKRAALGAELFFKSADPQQKYLDDTKELLTKYKWRKSMQDFLKKDMANSKSLYAQSQQEQNNLDAEYQDKLNETKFKQDMEMRKMRLEEKKVNLSVAPAKESVVKKTVAKKTTPKEATPKETAPKVKPKPIVKKAGVLSPMLDYSRDDDVTRINFKHNNNIYSDTKDAIVNFRKDDGMHNHRRNILLGDAALIGGIALGSLALRNSALKGVNSIGQLRTPLQKKLDIAALAALAGGAYGAYQYKDEDSKLKRNIGLGLSASGLLASHMLGKGISPKAYDQVPYLLGAGTLVAGGVGTVMHNGGAIEDHNTIQNELGSDHGYSNIARRVNDARERSTAGGRFPVLRFLNTLKNSDKLLNLRLADSSSNLSAKDEKYFIEAQTNRLFEEYKRGFEAVNARATQEELTVIRKKALNDVLSEIKKNRK